MWGYSFGAAYEWKRGAKIEVTMPVGNGDNSVTNQTIIKGEEVAEWFAQDVASVKMVGCGHRPIHGGGHAPVAVGFSSICTSSRRQ